MGHNHGSEGSSSKNIKIVFFLNLGFSFFELIGGYLTNSMAIMSDALHDFGDCISLAVAWGFEKKSHKEKNDKYSYGYKRFSLLGSIFLSVVLATSSIYILIEAIGRLQNPEAVNASGMLWLAIVGVGINLVAALRLKKSGSLSERAIFIHLMEDVMGWIAVLIGSIVMIFVELPILDPIMSIAITLWVLYNVSKNLIKVFNVLLMGVPSDVNVAKLSSDILAIEDVKSIHDIHIWSFDGENHVMTIHVVSKNQSQDFRQDIRDITSKYHINHITIEIDDSEEHCKYLKC